MDLMMVKGCLFAIVLIVASYIDIKTRTIPDWIHVLIMLIALIEIDWVESLIGLVLVPLPFFIMACIKEGSIGGGDVKLMASCGFILTFRCGLLGAIIGLSTAIVINCICDKLNEKKMMKAFALAPYLGIGCICIYIGKLLML